MHPLMHNFPLYGLSLFNGIFSFDLIKRLENARELLEELWVKVMGQKMFNFVTFFSVFSSLFCESMIISKNVYKYSTSKEVMHYIVK